MKRGGPLKRRTRLKPRNDERLARRRAKEFGPQAELCRSLPCCVPGCRKGPPSDPAHVRSRGAGGDDSDTVPMCRKHHTEQHATGIETFQQRYGLDLRAEALRLASIIERRGLA